jgi:hypothetical protein
MSRTVRPFLRNATAAVLAMLFLSACTSGFVYNRLDWLIPWYVDGYVDLTRAQRDVLRAQLEPRLAWHREEELARYAALLNRVEADLEETLTPATVRSWAEELLAAAQRVERSMMEVALEFGGEVSEAQLREFVDSLWERQSEYEEEFLERSDAEYAEDDYENLCDFIERFVGRLEPEQRAVLREAADELQRFDRAWLEERRAWLETLQPLLLERAPGWQAAVMAAYETRLEQRTPAYHATFEHNLEQITAAYARVLSSLTERQRSRAVKELQDLQRTLRKLMDQPREANRQQPAPAPYAAQARFSFSLVSAAAAH